MATLQMSSMTAAPLLKSNFLGGTKSLANEVVCEVPRSKVALIKADGSKTEENNLTACSRRNVFWLAATTAVGVSLAQEKPALAAYGEAANIFGTPKKQSGYLPIKKDGFSIDVPAKWNPSKEEDFDNVALRWEDNFDQGSHMVVLKQPSGGKNSIKDFGTPDAFIDQMSYLLGEQVFSNETQSEGGFGKNKVLAASLLSKEQKTDNSGNSYYKYEILTRTADGTEGGRHTLISASVKNGQLYVSKVTIGDKRWFKGLDKVARSVDASFSVA